MKQNSNAKWTYQHAMSSKCIGVCDVTSYVTTTMSSLKRLIMWYEGSATHTSLLIN
jgi:hypothetical protein